MRRVLLGVSALTREAASSSARVKRGGVERINVAAMYKDDCNVEVWDYSSIWYGCVIKGDVNLVRIGAFTNVQDNTTIHEALAPISEVHDGSTVIGHHVTIGHSCNLTACTVEDECLVGMGSILQEGSYMETHSMLGAGSVLARGARVPSGELWVGSPAKFQRHLTPAEIANFKDHARKYSQLAHSHKQQFLPHGTQCIYYLVVL